MPFRKHGCGSTAPMPTASTTLAAGSPPLSHASAWICCAPAAHAGKTPSKTIPSSFRQKMTSALRAGDIEALVQVLDPDLVVHIDKSAAATGVPAEIHGARNWAGNAVAFARHMRFFQPALVDGAVGILLAPQGRLTRVLRFTF